MSYYNTSVDVRMFQNCTVFPVNCFITECVLYMEVCDVVANRNTYAILPLSSEMTDGVFFCTLTMNSSALVSDGHQLPS